MEQDDEPPSGTVEIDETLVGVERGNNPKYRNVMSPFANKTPVAGAVQRGGRVVAVTVANVHKTTLLARVERRVLAASTVYSDELLSYTDLTRRGYAHSRVNHSERIYASGEVHTNTMEGFWPQSRATTCIPRPSSNVSRRMIRPLVARPPREP